MNAEPMGEHTVEAVSARVGGRIAHGDEMWGRCYDGLMAAARERLVQEIARLEGDYAHIIGESIDSRHDTGTDEAWLHGRFDYVLYRRPTSK